MPIGVNVSVVHLCVSPVIIARFCFTHLLKKINENGTRIEFVVSVDFCQSQIFPSHMITENITGTIVSAFLIKKMTAINLYYFFLKSCMIQ